MTAIVLANKSGDAAGKLPPSSCKQDNPTHVTCTGPAAGVSGDVFATYPSLKALYAAYTARVTALNSNQFKQNFSDCGAQGTYGEVGWNHLFQHTRAYSVDQMTMGMVKDDQAAAGAAELHPGPGVHGVDAERRSPHGLHTPGAHERAWRTGGWPYTTTSASAAPP